MTTLALPRSLDVQISISVLATEGRTDLTNICVVNPYDAAVPDKIRAYADLDSIGVDWGTNSDAYRAAEAFFAQSPAPPTLYVGQTADGYTDIATELAAIQAAAGALGKFIYGWILGATFRVASIQEAAATWALGQDKAIMPLVTNNVQAYDPAHTDDIGSVIGATGNRRAPCIFHDQAAYYPDMSILAYMLSVNYQLKDSAVTAKFKSLPGVPTVNLTMTQWLALKAKGYNTYTFVGNSSRTYREGMTEDVTYYMDDVINLDNFKEDLSVNVYNVFLRNRKVPYTRQGQMLLVDACQDTGNQYKYNGTFADRQVVDVSQKSGVAIVPAVQVIPQPIATATAAQRAGRIGPPIQMIVQMAGAIHSVAIAVNVVD